MKITENELISALEQAFAAQKEVGAGGDGGAMTRMEYAEKMDRDATTVANLIRRLVRSGQWECVKVWRKNITGSMRRDPGYRPVSKITQDAE